MLCLVTYRWRDGEQEYYTRRFTNSEDLDEANRKAEAYLSDMWADKTINDNGDYQPPCGYPIVRVSSITGCNTLEQAVKAIGFIDDDLAVEALSSSHINSQRSMAKKELHQDTRGPTEKILKGEKWKN